MTTKPDEEEPEPTPAAVIARRALEAARIVVAGSPAGSIRRIALYGIAIAMFAFAPPVAAVVGGVCVLLLIATDDLR